MREVLGTAVNGLVTMGPLRVIKKDNSIPEKKPVDNPDLEVEKLMEAIDKANTQLGQLYEATLASKGEEMAAIIEVQQMMLEDEGFLDSIKEVINDEQVCASYATYFAGKNYAKMFEEMDDEYMSARSADILDISGRIVRILENQEEIDYTSQKAILVADDLGPSETVRLDKDSVLAFVTVHGSVNSHTAILARTMNIPALVCVDINLNEITDNTEAIVDGARGVFILDPDETQKKNAAELMAAQEKDKESLKKLIGLPTETKSGRKIKLYANIGCPEDADSVLLEDGEGIGLFRSEFLYIGRDSAPSEEQQFEAYKEVLEKLGDRPVIIRTLDIGADKQADYLNIPKEENPALGLRAIRLCLTDKEMFKVQLRALLRAACFGDLLIMYPMIISESEIDEIHEVVNEAAKELEDRGIDYKIPKQGIMIETPAAVILSEQLAKKVDFFSIGTNDLSQYTLAIDRQNQSLERFFDAHHPAVLKMIEMVVQNSHKAGIWTGICGELAADTSLTETFAKMGVDELSVAPKAILKVRGAVREVQ